MTREDLDKLIEKKAAGEIKIIDLRLVDLRGVDLRLVDLRGADLQGVDLRGVDLRGANLREANLRGADLRGANLRRADLREADLREANLRGADLREANIDFSAFPLWCGSLGLVCDQGLISQLLYHLCSLDVKDCPEWEDLRDNEKLIELANKSHVIARHGLPKIERSKK